MRRELIEGIETMTTGNSTGPGIGRSGWMAALAAVALGVGPLSGQTPLAEFKFDEGSGKVIASTTNGLSGTLGLPLNPLAVPLSTTDSPSGVEGDRAVELANGAFLVVNDAPGPILAVSTTPLTLEGWVKHSSLSALGNEGIVAYGGAYKVGLNNGQLIFTLFGVVDVFSGFFLTPDTWHHVAVVNEPGVGVTFYLDGVPAFVEETRAMIPFGNAYLNIGAERLGTTITGSLDRIRIHSAVLPVEELDTVAATPKPVLTSTLVSYGFNEANGPWASAGTAARPTISGNAFVSELVAPVWDADSVSGSGTDRSLNFTTAGMRAVVPDPEGVIRFVDGNFTIQAWVKFGAQPGGRSVFFFNNGPGGAVSFSIANRRLFVTTLGIRDQASNAAIPDDGGWHHVAVVHENGVGFRFYVDGILGDTVAYTGGVLIDVRTATEFFIGSEPTGGLPYVGKLDRLMVSSGLVAPEDLDFRPVPGVDPEAPTLTIQTVVEVAWPTLPAGYTLQTTLTPENTASWVPVTGAPIAADGTFRFYAPITDARTFYRLFKPE